MLNSVGVTTNNYCYLVYVVDQIDAITRYTMAAFDVYIVITTTDLASLTALEQSYITNYARIATASQRLQWRSIGIDSAAHVNYDYNIRSNITKLKAAKFKAAKAAKAVKFKATKSNATKSK